MKKMLIAAMAVFAMAANARAEIRPDEVARLQSAARVISDIQAMIPMEYWNRARCVAVIPELRKAAFIVGGEYGKGVLSCRSGDGWSAPVFLQLAKGSWGFQAGAEQVDVVMLIMNERGVEKMLQNKTNLGIDVSVAAGPLGRQGQIATDAFLTAEILSYSRAQGLFAGIDLSGGVLRPDEDANRDVYGGATPSSILASRSISAPTQAAAFLNALNKVSVAAAAATNPPAQVTAAPASPAPPAANRSATVPSTTDSDLRIQVVALQQMVDRWLAATHAAPVGTTGVAGDTGAAIPVSKAELEQLRSRIEAVLATMDRR